MRWNGHTLSVGKGVSYGNMVGDEIDDLMDNTLRLRFGRDGVGHPREVRIIFAPHITGDPAHFIARPAPGVRSAQ